jgi:hypothetical protein
MLVHAALPDGVVAHPQLQQHRAQLAVRGEDDELRRADRSRALIKLAPSAYGHSELA